MLPILLSFRFIRKLEVLDHLNPIERVWKFVRKKFFKDRYRETFAKFCTQLQDFCANLDQYRTELTTLLTENFELFLRLGNHPLVPDAIFRFPISIVRSNRKFNQKMAGKSTQLRGGGP